MSNVALAPQLRWCDSRFIYTRSKPGFSRCTGTVLLLFTLALSACGGGDGGGESSTPAPPANTLSVIVDAPESVSSYTTVELDGSLSRAPDSSIQSYAWTQTDGASVVLAGSNASVATFTAPNVTTPTTLTFTLIVTDATGATAKASPNVNIIPATTEQLEKLKPSFIALRFLKAVSGGAHTDVVMVDGPPLIGSKVLVQATLSGSMQSPVFEVVDTSGQTLSTASMTLSSSASAQPLNFFGEISVPTAPFQLIASGITTLGHPYFLPSPTLVAPMNMTLEFVPHHTLIARGASETVQLEISNAGPAALFTVNFNDPFNLLAQPPDMIVQIDQGQSASVPVTATFPASLTSTPLPTLTVTASVGGDPTRVGTVTLMLMLDGAL